MSDPRCLLRCLFSLYPLRFRAQREFRSLPAVRHYVHHHRPVDVEGVAQCPGERFALFNSHTCAAESSGHLREVYVGKAH